ncbi:phospholipid carrier-dependent glycosyltransferase [Methanoculleus sp. YWC-01]|uniref:Phospholipid carrier-dependent glycosyltransferase n=1 Tax=Methanoculleus nereidis TaxID=2735141 RepID=A0ABU3Z534_9EURY|nr:glycosyltransferase family 39 protein [Methanoculleus sp. YWC-01]MDV4343675.1 phospholipid carrier-dependent glycosyltransferase [Methanoculleus sp. YWC-01]
MTVPERQETEYRDADTRILKDSRHLCESAKTRYGASVSWILIGLAAAGALLRLYNLGGNSLWLDEAATLTFARQTLAGIWETTAAGEFNPPLFYWLEHGMLLFGESEFVLRLLPALFGILTVPVVYLIGREFRDRNVGLIAAALLAFSPFHIFYSQEARAYAPMLFFFSLALLFYVRAGRSDETRSWVLFGVFSAAAFWMHFYAVVPVAVLILHALVTRAGEIRKDVRNAKNPALALVAFVVATLPLLIVTVNLFLVRTSSAPTFGMQGLSLIYHTFLQITGSGDLNMVLFGILFLVGVAYTWCEDRNGALLLVLMMALPLAASLVLSSRMPMIPRYLIYLLPVYFVGIASAYPALLALVRERWAVAIFIAAAVLVAVPLLSTYYTIPQKNDWRGFSAELGAMTGEGDLVVVLPPYIAQPLDYYYSNATDGTLEMGATTEDDLEAIRDRYPGRRAFYVATADIFAADPSGNAAGWLEENTRVVGQHTGINLLVSSW